MLGGDPAALSSLVARKPEDAGDEWVPPWVVSAVRADLLPPGATALEGADAVVIGGDPGSEAVALSPGLGAFVGSGGVLLVAGGDAGLAAAGPALSLLPVVPEGTAAGDLRPIAEMFVREAEPLPVPLVRARLRDGVALAFAPDGSPLAALATRGLGTVAWLACGLGDSALRKAGVGKALLEVLVTGKRLAAGAVDAGLSSGALSIGNSQGTLWAYPGGARAPARRLWAVRGGARVLGYDAILINDGTGRPNYYAWRDGKLVPLDRDSGPTALPTGDEYAIWAAPQRSLKLPLPAGASVARVLGGYCAAVTTALLLLGRRLRRPALAWVLAAIGGVAAFVGLSVRAGAQFSATLAGASLTIAEGAVGGRSVSATSSVAVYSPTGVEDVLSASAPAERIAAPPRLPPGTEPPLPCGTVEGAAARVHLAPRAATGFRLEGTLSLGDGLFVEPIQEGETRKGWRIRNGTGRALRNVEVLDAKQRGLAGDMTPGSVVDVWPENASEARDADLATRVGDLTYHTLFQQQLVEALLRRSAGSSDMRQVAETSEADPPPADASEAAALFRSEMRRQPRGPDSLLVLAETDGPLADVSLPGRRIFTPGQVIVVLRGQPTESRGATWPGISVRPGNPARVDPFEQRSAEPGTWPVSGQPWGSDLKTPCRILPSWPIAGAEFQAYVALRPAILPPRGASVEVFVDRAFEHLDPPDAWRQVAAEIGRRFPEERVGPIRLEVRVRDPKTGRWGPAVEVPTGHPIRLPEACRLLDDDGEIRLVIGSTFLEEEASNRAPRENRVLLRHLISVLGPSIWIRSVVVRSEHERR
ncbi:MAG: hypothetical protein L0216_08195 [Planctomycetales bacterium]|nr:hypothetical protein [Planctomycetales bacterium]